MSFENRRNNLFRTMVSLTIFGFAWIVYESLTIGLFQKIAKLDLRIGEHQHASLQPGSFRSLGKS